MKKQANTCSLISRLLVGFGVGSISPLISLILPRPWNIGGIVFMIDPSNAQLFSRKTSFISSIFMSEAKNWAKFKNQIPNAWATI